MKRNTRFHGAPAEPPGCGFGQLCSYLVPQVRRHSARSLQRGKLFANEERTAILKWRRYTGEGLWTAAVPPPQ